MYLHRNRHTAQNKDNKLHKVNINIKLLCTDINEEEEEVLALHQCHQDKVIVPFKVFLILIRMQVSHMKR